MFVKLVETWVVGEPYSMLDLHILYNAYNLDMKDYTYGDFLEYIAWAVDDYSDVLRPEWVPDGFVPLKKANAEALMLQVRENSMKLSPSFKERILKCIKMSELRKELKRLEE